MKKLNIFTPPPKKNTQHNAHFTLNGRKLKRTAVAFSLMLCFSLTACSSSDAEQSSEEGSDPQISSFNGYDWGTSCEDIKTTEISADMKELLDYEENNGVDELDGMSVLSFFKQSVAGYSATIEYAFSNDELVAGLYGIDIDEEIYADLLEKLTLKYGNPDVEKDSTGWGNVSVWIDDSKNMLCLSEFFDALYYIAADSPLLNILNEQFIEFHELDITSVLSGAAL